MECSYSLLQLQENTKFRLLGIGMKKLVHAVGKSRKEDEENNQKR